MCNRRRVILLALVLLAASVLACACSPTATPRRAPTPTATVAAEPTRSLTAVAPSPLPSFGYGVEYGNFDGGVLGTPRRAPAAVYAAVGAAWVKFQDITWNMIVPRSGLKPCTGYSWGQLDRWVSEWQAAGFDIQIHLGAHSNWASQPKYRKDLIGGFGTNTSTPPKPDQWDAYGDFVACVVERYDADGIVDMASLRRPILDFEIESEVGVEMFWQGTAEEYLRLLTLAYTRAKAANPRVRIIASGLGIGDFFDDGAGAEVWAPRTSEMRERTRDASVQAAFDRGRGFLDLIVQHPESFDVVEFHWLTDYKAVPGAVAWIRGEMARRGYQKPVWAGDATSAPNLVVAPAYFPDRPFNAADRLRLVSILNAPKNANYTATERWFRAEQAKLSVKKLVTGMAAGLEGVNLCCLQDWPVVTGFPFQGLSEENQPRPVLYSLGVVARKLAGYAEVKTLALGKNVYAYRFTVNSKTVDMLWYDDGHYYQMGQTEPVAAVALPFSAPEARITHIITVRGQTEPSAETVAVSEGRLSLTLNSAPVIIEAIR